MSCMTELEMELYMLEKDPARKAAGKAHLDACPACRKLYRACLEEQAAWSERIFAAELPENFTDNVMLEIDKLQLETAANGLGEVTEAGGTSRYLRKRRWRRSAAVVLLLILAGSLAMITSPTLAELVRSLFGRNTTDVGLLRAQEFGLVNHPGIRVKDQGYTVRVDEVVADPTRVVMALQLFDPDGKHDRNKLMLTDPNAIAIKDAQGKVVKTMYDMGSTEDFYYLVAFFPEPLMTENITIEGRISRLGNEERKQQLPELRGNWDFDIRIDMKEALSKTTIVPLQGEYTSPDGLTVRLKRLTRMVQGVRFEVETELSPEALERSPGDLWQKQALSFHFEDMAGEEIHSYNTRGSSHMDSLMSESHIPDQRRGVMHLSYTFKYLPADTPYRFVFDGYYIPEKDGTELEFEPAKLAKQPVSVAAGGDTLTLRELVLEPHRDYGVSQPEATLYIDGKLLNEFSHTEYEIKAKDDGHRYRVEQRGVISQTEDGYLELSGGDMPPKPFEFYIPGLTVIPERLTLIRPVVNKAHRNVDWSVSLLEPVAPAPSAP